MAALARRGPGGIETSGPGVVGDWLRWRSAVSPLQPAVKRGPVQWNYRELDERVGVLAGTLLSWGVRRGARVCLLLQASEEYVAVVHALTRVGAVTVPLNVRLSPREILGQLRDCRPSLVVYDPPLSDLRARIAEEDGEGARLRWRSSVELRGGSRRRALAGGHASASSVHSIIYTSGSTGEPKGVPLTVSNLLWNAISVGLRGGISSSDRWLLVLPLFHVGGYTIIFRSVLHGSSIVVHPRFEASDVSESVERDGITVASLVPTMLERLLAVRGRRRLPKSLRLIFLGGSPPSASLTRAIRERALPVLATYGMTETCSQVAASRMDASRGSDGIVYLPMFPTDVAIGSGGGGPKKRGAVGEILVRGPTVFGGYWRSPGRTAAALEGGWFRTGDAGYLDAAGGLVVLGRREEMIKSGGEIVFPAEVESALLEHEAVEEAVVLGMEDAGWGERVEAVVSLREGSAPPSPSELTRFLRERIGGYKIPKKYHIWRSIPKTSTGKAKRDVVRALLEPDGVKTAG